MAAGIITQYPKMRISGAIFIDWILSVSPVAIKIYPEIMVNKPNPKS